MPLIHTGPEPEPSPAVPVGDDLDRESQRVQWAVGRARRNPWFGGDLLDAAFEPVLAAIVATRSIEVAAALEPGPAWRDHQSRWAEPSRRA